MPESSSPLPRVTIGMPVYNGGSPLISAIDSLLAQEFKDFEFIISDNASTDDTERICREYAARDPRIRYVRRDRNYGMNDNGRHVLSLARAPWYMMAAHDDRWDPRFIGACVEQFEKNPSLVLVSPGVTFVNTEGVPVSISYPPLHTVGMGIRSRVAAIFNQINVGFNAYGMYRTDTLRRINLNIEMFAGDVVILLQVMVQGETAHVPEPLFTYRFKPRSHQEHIAAVTKDAVAPQNDRLYTILTINLLRAIVNAPIDRTIRNVIVSDAIQIIAAKNGYWRAKLLSENPELLPYIEPSHYGFSPFPDQNVIGCLSGFLLPLCPPGAPFEGVMDIAHERETGSLSGSDRLKPVPGLNEFIETLNDLVDKRRIVQALGYFDDNACFQAPVAAIGEWRERINRYRPRSAGPESKPGGGGPARSYRVLVLSPPLPASANTVEITVMRRLMQQLHSLGHQVRVATEPPGDLSGIDIVHLFTLTPAITAESIINTAIGQQKPVIVTPLWNPVPDYHRAAWQSFQTMKHYIEKGQRPEALGEMKYAIVPAPFFPPVPSRYAIRYAHRVFASGSTESAMLRDLRGDAAIDAVTSGSDIVPGEVAGELFERRFGVKNSVLCSSDLSLCNNQLMLLFVLEKDDIPVVFVDGGGETDPCYAALCRKMKRKGPTIFTGPIPDDLLASAYRCARVHCLPAWYDRSGLATIEAARYGCAVVASNNGVVRDYMGDHCIYCRPDSPGSIRKAIEQAFSQGPKPGARERASSFVWQETGAKVDAIYREAIGEDGSSPLRDYSMMIGSREPSAESCG